MKIQILTISYHPDPIGIAPLADDLSLGLRERGHDVTVVTGLPHYPSWTIPAEYRNLVFRTERRHGGVRVMRSFMRVSAGTSLWAKSLLYGTFTAGASINSLRAGATDVVLVISPPPTTIFSAWLRKILRGTPIVLNVQDVVPDAAITLGVMKGKLQIRFFRWLEKFAYRNSDHIVVVAPNFVDNLSAKGVHTDRITVISNWIDPDLIKPYPRMNEFRTSNGIPEDKLLVMYAGNMGLSQGLEVVIHAADRLREIGDVLFCLVGGGNQLRELRDLADRRRLPNVRFLPPQPEMRWLQAAADISLVLQKPDVRDINLPSKIPVIMASGRPIIAGVNPNGDAARIVLSAEAGVLVPAGDAGRLAEAVLQLRNDPDRRRRLGEAGRRYAVANFSRKASLDAYEAILSRTAAQFETVSKAHA